MAAEELKSRTTWWLDERDVGRMRTRAEECVERGRYDGMWDTAGSG